MIDLFAALGQRILPHRTGRTVTPQRGPYQSDGASRSGLRQHRHRSQPRSWWPSPLRRQATAVTRIVLSSGLLVSAATAGPIASFAGVAAQASCVQPALEGCPLPLQGEVMAAITEPEQVHMWHLTLSSTRPLQLRLMQLPVDYDLHVFGPDGLKLDSMQEGTADDAIEIESAPAGVYQVYVNSPWRQTSDAPYALMVSAPEPQPEMPVPTPVPTQIPIPAPATPAPAPTPAAIGADTAGRVAALRTLQGHSGSVQAIAVSPDGRLAASGSGDRSAKLWNLATGEEVRTLLGHGGSIESVAFSPDSRQLATASDDRRVKLWDVTSGRDMATLQLESPARSVAYSPDGRVLATGEDGARVTLWALNADGGRVIRTLEQRGVVRFLAFSPDGKQLAAGADDGRVRLWDVTNINGGQIRALDQGAAIRGLAYSTDGKTLIAGSEDRAIRLWEVDRGREITSSEHGAAVTGLALSPGGRIVASAGMDRTVRLWDWDSGNYRAAGALTGHASNVNGVAFTPNGQQLLSAGRDGAIIVWGVR